MIPVARPFLPPIGEYQALLAEVWAAKWLTNQGPKVQALESALTTRCGAPTVYVANGTLAIQLALRAAGAVPDLGPRSENSRLPPVSAGGSHREPSAVPGVPGVKRIFRSGPVGTVLTTPFSFVATTSAPLWEGWGVQYVDVDPGSLNLSPDALARADAPPGSVVLATHVYGAACEVDAIAAIAAERGWVTIYDAAHAFGTTWRGRPLFAFGDLVCTSFHATKLFHTGEGGAVFVGDAERKARVERLRSFGERAKGEFVEVGINAKCSELHACMGLSLLPHMDAVLARRKEQSLRYRAALGDRVGWQQIPEACGYNHAYVPVFLRDESAVLRVTAALADAQIQGRRYFWPSLSTLPFAPRDGAATPVSDDAARRVLCLPVFHELTDAQIDHIAGIVDAHR